MVEKISEDDIRKFYKFFQHTRPTEIRMFDKQVFPSGMTIFVKDENEFVDTIRKYNNDKEVDVYIGGRERVDTKDENVVSSYGIFLEIDEHDVSKPLEFEKLKTFLLSNGITINMDGLSGGGYHVYIQHNLMVLDTPERKEAYKKYLLSFRKALRMNNIDVDTKVFNLERVSRVLGSYNHKRQSMSKIITYQPNANLQKNTDYIRHLVINYEDKGEVEVNQSAIEILEKYKINQYDKWLWDILKNQVKIKQDTGGNSVVYKNAAIVLTKENLLKEEISVVGRELSKLVLDRPLSAFEGWVSKCLNNEISEVFKNEINKFIVDNNYPLTKYVLNQQERSENVNYYKRQDVNKLKNRISNLTQDEVLRKEEVKNILYDSIELDLLDRDDILNKLKDKANVKRTILERQLNEFRKEYKKSTKVEKFKSNKNFCEALDMMLDKKELIRRFLNIQPIYFERKNQFWIWNTDNFCWEERDETDILNLISKKVNGVDTINSTEKNELLEALKQVGRENKPLDIKPTWVQFKDKIYDIDSGSCFEATPKYFITNPINWKVGDSEDTPFIDSLIKSWVCKEDVSRLYEIVAFTIIPKYFIHSFFFLYSPPGMGKSTFTNLLIKFLGKDNHVSTSIDRINYNSRFETKSWHKKLLITLSEVSDVNDLKNSGLINQATGEDPIKAEIKGGEDFDFVNYGKFVYPTNKLLKVDENDGFGRRVRKVIFITRFEKERDVIEEIPECEFNNLAKKVLRIATELWKKRQFTGDVSISERMAKYQEDSKTPLERFIDEYCDLSDFNSKMLFDEFCSKFLLITKQNLSKIAISKELRKNLGFDIKYENFPVYNDNESTTKEWKSATRISGLKWKNS